jgi:hypothetical protein
MGHEIFNYTHGPYSRFILLCAILRVCILGQFIDFDFLELKIPASRFPFYEG